MNSKPTRTIRAIDVWPGMILADHTHRGRVADVRGWGDTVEILFHDNIEGFTYETGDDATVNIVKEF